MLDINLKQLEVFVTTAEYGSFTRAADVLYLSQSTVSSHIRSLEEPLGVLLFDRAARRRVALTEAGKRIYPTAREIVDRCRALQSNLPEREGNLLTVGASTVPAQYLIPRLLADFSRQRPDCQFLLRRGDSAGIHELLRSGQPRKASAPIMTKPPSTNRTAGAEPALARNSLVARDIANAPSTRPMISGRTYCTLAAL